MLRLFVCFPILLILVNCESTSEKSSSSGNNLCSDLFISDYNDVSSSANEYADILANKEFDRSAACEKNSEILNALDKLLLNMNFSSCDAVSKISGETETLSRDYIIEQQSKFSKVKSECDSSSGGESDLNSFIRDEIAKLPAITSLVYADNSENVVVGVRSDDSLSPLVNPEDLRDCNDESKKSLFLSKPKQFVYLERSLQTFYWIDQENRFRSHSCRWGKDLAEATGSTENVNKVFNLGLVNGAPVFMVLNSNNDHWFFNSKPESSDGNEFALPITRCIALNPDLDLNNLSSISLPADLEYVDLSYEDGTTARCEGGVLTATTFSEPVTAYQACLDNRADEALCSDFVNGHQSGAISSVVQSNGTFGLLRVGSNNTIECIFLENDQNGNCPNIQVENFDQIVFSSFNRNFFSAYGLKDGQFEELD